MNLKVIKNELDYSEALKDLMSLMSSNPAMGSEERNNLEVLSVLIEQYEGMTFTFDTADPITVIRVVMDQKGLSSTDMVQYLGSKARVSEVLNKKRGLTLSMIRTLNKQLGIPAELLISDPQREILDTQDIDWTAFPLRELIKRGWFSEHKRVSLDMKLRAEELVRESIFKYLGFCQTPVLNRQGGYHMRSKDSSPDEYALAAWQARVVEKALTSPINVPTFEIDETVLRRVAELSILDDGPIQAIALLRMYGIRIVFEPNFEKTYLDGGAMLLLDDAPVIGLTLRYNRLDNFWFTLLHELAHVVYHLTNLRQAIFDDNDADADSDIEIEADRVSQEALIPTDRWDEFRATELANDPNIGKLKQWALELKINPAILAGRIRHDSKNYKIYSSVVGNRIPLMMLQSII